MTFAASCALAVLLVAAPAGAAEGTRYVVRLSAASVAERLELADHIARQYGGRIVDSDSVAGDATIELTAAQADALARDRRVASVTAIANTSSITLGPYVYDGAGNISKIGSETYRYDSLSRLVNGTAAGGTRTQTYAYDGYGNLEKMVTAGGGPSVTRELPIDPSTNRIATPTATSNVTATYDAAGNETSINSGPTRSYDALRMMTANGQGAVYLYTADDERIAVTNQTRTSWQWTLRGTDHKPLRELKETVSGSTRQWNWVRDYVYADGTLLAAYTNHPTPARTLQHYHLDHLGTPRLITDSNGSEITRDELFPFGEDPSFNIADPERLHFTGHERDYDGGTSVANGDSLDYMHARYYSPTLGRFLSVDPEMNIANALREPQQWNRYSYVVNNPLKYADPDGRDKFMAWLLGDAFRDVSTWDALKGALSTGPMVRAVDEGRQEWAEDHRAATRGFSPVPTTREEIAMAPVFMMLGPGGGAARTTLAEAKTLIGAWGKGTFSTLAKTIGYHFEKHGAEVGAKSMLQYLRKAYEFNRNLRGAEKVALENGATRYIKNGYYIIKDETGRILSYGRVAQ